MPTKKTSRKQATAKKTLGRTFLNLIVDESGSMWGIKAATIDGVNTYLDGLRDAKRTYVTLTKFNTSKNVLYAMEKVKDAPRLNALNYLPSGGTSLYDAIGACVKAMGKEVKKGDRVLTLIVTDGAENSSKEYSKADCKTLITSLEAQGNWTFTFLGANLDVAKEVGRDWDLLGELHRVPSDRQSAPEAFSTMSASTGNYMQSSAQNMQNFYQPANEDTKVFSGKPRRRVIP
jgi:hypothetical protein